MVMSVWHADLYYKSNILVYLGKTKEKKSYKILEEICKLQSDASSEFFEKNLPGNNSYYSHRITDSFP